MLIGQRRRLYARILLVMSVNREKNLIQKFSYSYCSPAQSAVHVTIQDVVCIF